MPDLQKRLTDALAQSGSASSDFDLNKDLPGPTGQLTPAAVLVAVRPQCETVILTQRAAGLKHHPGQIAFPGGKQDPTDATLVDTALREAHEEIGLPAGIATVLGALPTHQTVTGYQMTPILAVLTEDFTPIVEAGEVSDVFEVPLAHVTTLANFTIQGGHWQGSTRAYYTVPYGPHYIWGATARILHGLAVRLA